MHVNLTIKSFMKVCIALVLDAYMCLTCFTQCPCVQVVQTLARVTIRVVVTRPPVLTWIAGALIDIWINMCMVRFSCMRARVRVCAFIDTYLSGLNLVEVVASY